MFRAVAIICLAVLSPALSLPAADNDRVELTYRPILKPGNSEYLGIDVVLRFPGDSDGVTDIELPNEWGGFGGLYKYVSGLVAAGGELSAGNEPHRYTLRHASNARVTLSYRITGVDRPDKLGENDDGNEYRPIINPTYFHLIGNAVLVRPGHLSNDTPASFGIIGLPEGVAFASDLQHGSKEEGLTFGDLIESVAVGGDFRILDAGNGARLAIRSAVDARDDAGWIKAYGDVSRAITGYWESQAGPYLVTILPFAPANEGSISVGGTGRSDAYAFFTTRNAPPETLDLIMSHEMVHSWVPRRIGSMDDGPDEPQSYWFSEGFTDFTSWRALVRAGLWTPEQYAAKWNEALGEYNRLSVREASNAEAAKLFWTSAEGQRLPYLRGMLFASWLDDELRRLKKPTTLRTILLRMQREATKLKGEQVEKKGYGIGLLRHFSAKAGLSLDKAIAEYIDAGKAAPFGPQFMAACGLFETKTRATFHRGFDARASVANNNMITGVIVDGPAWKAGLRDGMKLVRRSGGEIGNSEVEIAYDVEDAGVAKTLRWMPEGEGQETVRRIVIDKAKDAACKAYLSN
jgi:predicted metalloprotease with PDZ domain